MAVASIAEAKKFLDYDKRPYTAELAKELRDAGNFALNNGDPRLGAILLEGSEAVSRRVRRDKERQG